MRRAIKPHPKTKEAYRLNLLLKANKDDMKRARSAKEKEEILLENKEARAKLKKIPDTYKNKAKRIFEFSGGWYTRR